MSTDLRVVIVGGHHVGYHAACHLDNRGHDVVIVEKDRDRVDFLADEYVATVIQGDGSRRSVLEQADIGRTDVLAALTGYGAMTNIGICMVAQRIDDVRTVARIDHGDTEEYAGMVDAIVYPEELAAHAATNEIMNVAGEGVRTIEQVSADLELVEIAVSGDAPAAGKRLEQVSFPRGAVVVGARESSQVPGPEMQLQAGNRYVLAVQSDVADEVVRLLRG